MKKEKILIPSYNEIFNQSKCTIEYEIYKNSK